MKLPTRKAKLLFLLAPAIATALTSEIVGRDEQAAVGSRTDSPAKVAPIDGNDGKPHNGPWVETDGRVDDDLPALKGRPVDPTVIDGQRIPESNDGVMDDPNRQLPKEGTRGTEGGVSGKPKGDGEAKVPETPKEAPIHHAPEEHIAATEGSQGEGLPKSSEGSAGIEKPEDLPERVGDTPIPVPGNSGKSNPDPSHGGSSLEPEEGVIEPFHSFVISLTMILVSEVGDKTFLVAALMAMKHDRMVVFSAAFSALLVMTVLSAVLGQAVPTLLSKHVSSFLAAVLFFIFGAKLLKEGLAMSPDEGVAEEMHEVERELAEKEKDAYALEMGVGGEGRKSRPKGRFPAPPRSPSTSPHAAAPQGRSLSSMVEGVENLLSLLLSPAWVQTFIMTFLGEWGDRSQIATIAMSAGSDYWWVTLGAMAGHCVCTGVAVLGGRAIAGKVSMKVVTLGGAIAFLIFGIIYLYEALF
ncbi:unnamed protein product [Parascedosporium putredinis]|uniref:Uncharacterized protein n=1 Tax=Parascedosporium putredinis TaxID=1442378 RepID=A0A9P1MF02_9PEZI|nr:unnamed protein product [Parascedosporium putredinis]CAI8001453.1 unnamed protein product [Parascedosporium putredinis]